MSIMARIVVSRNGVVIILNLAIPFYTLRPTSISMTICISRIANTIYSTRPVVVPPGHVVMRTGIAKLTPISTPGTGIPKLTPVSTPRTGISEITVV